MDYLFPSVGSQTVVTPLGAAVICVVILVILYYYLRSQGNAFVKAGFGYGGSSGLALRATEKERAGFQSGYEPPAFWGTSGDSELYDDQHRSAGEGETYSQYNPGAKAGFVGTDQELLAKAKGYGM